MVPISLSRKNSSNNTAALVRGQSSTHLNGFAQQKQPQQPSANGVAAGHDKPHSNHPSTPASPAGSTSSNVPEFKFFENSAPTTPPPPPSVGPKQDKSAMARITRIFSQSGKDKKKDEDPRRKNDNVPLAQHSGSTTPMPRHPEKEDGSSDTDG